MYEETLQADALALVAAKMRSALMVEGELPEDGLAALEGDGPDMFVALARQLTEGRVQDGHSLEAMFAQAQAVEAEADGYLVEGTWETPEDVKRDAVLTLPGTTCEQGALEGEALDLWRQVFTDKVESDRKGVVEPDTAANGRMINFDELARLVGRPRRRQKPVPEGQLALF